MYSIINYYLHFVLNENIKAVIDGKSLSSAMEALMFLLHTQATPFVLMSSVPRFFLIFLKAVSLKIAQFILLTTFCNILETVWNLKAAYRV